VIQEHVAEAVKAELANPRQTNDGRAEAAALAACSTLALIGSSMVVPIGGPVAVAAGLAAFAPSFRRDASERTIETGIREQVQEALDRELSGRVLPSKTTDERVKAWQAWIPWCDLCAGKKVEVPPELPHPTTAGFEFVRSASKVGQAVDWAASLADGSRLHIHEFSDGRRVMHRDKMDPAQGPTTAVLHWISEAPEGQALGAALGLGLVVLAWMVTPDSGAW
jgi:hypothetical protein